MPDVPRYAFGDFELDTGRVQLLKDRAALPLEPKAFAVLRLLVERAPHVVDKAEIFAAAWRDTAVTDNALTRIVTQLRKALGDDAKDPRYIATVSTRGYRLLPDVRLVGSGTPPALAPAGVPATDAVGRRAPSTSWRPVLLATVALVLGLAALGAWLARGEQDRASTGTLGDLDVAVAASLRAQQLTVATGFDGYVAFSPDGTSIAYSSDRSGALEIYVEGLAEGSTPASLTAGAGQCIQPAWSPDGRFVAYHEMSGNGIWVVPSRGGTARKIADVGAHPSWSADGRRIAFQSRSPADLNPGGSFGAESTIWVVDVDGGSPPKPVTAPGRPVGSHGMPQWWPGTNRVVFAVSAPAGLFRGAALWSVDPADGDLQPLSAHERLTSEFVVAPDGRGVLFAAKHANALWWLPIADGRAGEPRPTALPVTGPALASLALSADGRRVAWTAVDTRSGIWAAAVGRGAPPVATPIVPSEEIGWRATNPAVAPDGRLAFVGNRGNARSKIFLADAGRAPRQVTTDPHDHWGPLWTPDGRAIAVLADHADGAGWWLLDPATGRERRWFLIADVARPAGLQTQVFGPSAGMAMSRDLRRLAIAFVGDGVPNLWTTDLGPGGPSGAFVQRTFEPIGGSFGAWSPDGRWLAYQCTRGGDTQICVVDTTATPPAPARQITHDPGTHFNGEWLDDDTLVVAGKRAALWNVMRVSRSAGTSTPLTAFVEPRFHVRYPRWDRANGRVVFERFEATGRLWAIQIPLSAAGSPDSRPAR